MKNNKINSTSSSTLNKEKIESYLEPIIILTTIIGILLGAIESLTGFLNILKEHFYLSNTILYVITILLTFRINWSKLLRHRISVKTFRVYFTIIVSIIYLFSIGMTYYEYNLKETDPSDEPDIKLFLNHLFLGSTAFAQTVKKTSFQIDTYYLNEDLCSFIETKELLFAQPGTPRYKTFAYNVEVQSTFQKGECIGVKGNKPIENVLPLIKERLRKNNKQNLIRYIERPRDLSRVIRERADIFKQIIFTNNDLLEMKEKAPYDYQKVKEWLLYCVGVQNPVITMVVRNNGDKQIILTKVVYDVLDVGTILGGTSGPLYPEITYDHKIKHEIGEQLFYLKPPIKILPHDIVSFNIRIISATKGHGLGWLLKICLENSDGDYVTTDPFQIFMSK